MLQHGPEPNVRHVQLAASDEGVERIVVIDVRLTRGIGWRGLVAWLLKLWGRSVLGSCSFSSVRHRREIILLCGTEAFWCLTEVRSHRSISEVLLCGSELFLHGTQK